MDDAARLIEDLERKLEEIDHKVAAYRADMAAEFQHHSQALLKDAAPDVSAEVRRVIAESISNYPAIRPSLNLIESLRRHDRHTWHGRGSPPPNFRREGSREREPEEESDSPREREREFRGVFTPSYLPLLESSRRQSPQSPPAIRLSPSPEPAENPLAAHDEKAGAVLGRDIPMRPTNVRRGTDETTTSSVVSDRSDSKTRRSAMRRTSSSSKPQSPRRVRFEVAGSEVLPSSSPHRSAMDGSQTEGEALPTVEVERTAEEILGPDLIPEPPPKKVSSSQKLRELSRVPLNDRTVWTTVTQTPYESVDELEAAAALSASNSSSTIRSLKTRTPSTALGGDGTPAPDVLDTGTPSVTAEPSQLQQEDEEEEEDDSGSDSVSGSDSDSDSDDGGFLSMGRPKSFANKKPILSPRAISPRGKAITSSAASPAKLEPNSKSKRPATQASAASERIVAEESDDEELPFELEEDANAVRKPRQSSQLDMEDEVCEPPETVSAVDLSQYSGSPAVSIARQTAPAPPTPTTAKFQIGSVGSYRGRPMTMPVVRDPRVQEAAESMGEFRTFVGGVDGRSGMDDGDLSSFRASLSRPTNTSGKPRSLTERLIMEEEVVISTQREGGPGSGSKDDMRTKNPDLKSDAAKISRDRVC